MHRLFCLITALFAGATTLHAADQPALDVRLIPGERLYQGPGNAAKGYRDLMVQTVLVVNRGQTPLTIDALDIRVTETGGGTTIKTIPVAGIVGETARFIAMNAAGYDVFFKAQLLTEEGLPDGLILSEGARLTTGTALITTGHYMATKSPADSVEITAYFKDDSGAARSSSTTVAVHTPPDQINYRAPLSGTWLVRGEPSLQSHHRYIPSNEFALDFFKTGPDGAIDAKDGASAEDDYGYGAPVLAAADGEVIFVIDGQTQPVGMLSRQDGESIAEARARITALQRKRFATNFRAAVAGNMVTIKHEKNGVVQYSSYAHLMPGSLKVRVGDIVQQGQAIAAVGNTGDSSLTHLHFQVNGGPDAFYSPSIPVAFDGAKSLYLGQDPGRFFDFEHADR